MSKNLKKVVINILALGVLAGIVIVLGNIISWILASDYRTGLTIGIAGTTAIGLIFRMISE
jgi:hypothetical protein